MHEAEPLRDLGTIRLGAAASWGVLTYAIGEFTNGPLADLFGGRRIFLLGMAGSRLFTLPFAPGGALVAQRSTPDAPRSFRGTRLCGALDRDR